MKKLISFFLFLAIPFLSHASSLTNYFKDKEIDIFPVPIWETRPDKGESYGLMPILIMSEKNDGPIKALFGLIGQYNKVSKWGGGGLAYFFPTAEQEILFNFEIAQNISRDFSFRFFDPHFFEKYYIEFDSFHRKTPFGRFYGIGALRTESQQSNYTGQTNNIDLSFGRYLSKYFRTNLDLAYHTTDVLAGTLGFIPDTLTIYGGLPEVVDSSNFIYGLSLSFDNRENSEYSTKGTYLNAGYFFSNSNLGSDKNFHGYKLEAIQLFPTIKDRLTTALRFNFQEMFGSVIPFYEMNSLGGENELRYAPPQRYTDKGKIIFQIEERIRLFTMSMMGKSFDAHLDPFVSAGRVFDQINHLSFKNWQLCAGLGFRIFVPPNIVGRLDIAVGSDGIEMYTSLGYPF